MPKSKIDTHVSSVVTTAVSCSVGNEWDPTFLLAFALVRDEIRWIVSCFCRSDENWAHSMHSWRINEGKRFSSIESTPISRSPAFYSSSSPSEQFIFLYFMKYKSRITHWLRHNWALNSSMTPFDLRSFVEVCVCVGTCTCTLTLSFKNFTLWKTIENSSYFIRFAQFRNDVHFIHVFILLWYRAFGNSSRFTNGPSIRPASNEFDFLSQKCPDSDRSRVHKTL